MTLKSHSRASGKQARRSRRWLSLGAVIVLFALGVPSALAIHEFTDGPNASPFHADISAVKGAGITAGKTCEPPGTLPTFRPSEPITREAIAAFVHRGLGRVGYDADIFQTGISTFIETPTSIADITIDVGVVAGQKEFVKLDAHVVGLIENASGCVHARPRFSSSSSMPTRMPRSRSDLPTYT